MVRKDVVSKRENERQAKRCQKNCSGWACSQRDRPDEEQLDVHHNPQYALPDLEHLEDFVLQMGCGQERRQRCMTILVKRSILLGRLLLVREERQCLVVRDLSSSAGLIDCSSYCHVLTQCRNGAGTVEGTATRGGGALHPVLIHGNEVRTSPIV